MTLSPSDNSLGEYDASEVEAVFMEVAKSDKEGVKSNEVTEEYIYGL